MNVTKNLISIAVLGLASFAANAAGSASGTVSAFFTENTGVFVFYLTGTPTGQPGCGVATARFAINTTTNAGLSDAAAVKFAAALSKTVSVSGTGTCSVKGDTETVSVVSVTI